MPDLPKAPTMTDSAGIRTHDPVLVDATPMTAYLPRTARDSTSKAAPSFWKFENVIYDVSPQSHVAGSITISQQCGWADCWRVVYNTLTDFQGDHPPSPTTTTMGQEPATRLLRGNLWLFQNGRREN